MTTPALTIETIRGVGWRIEHPAWHGHSLLIRRDDGIIVPEDPVRSEVMVTPSALVLRGEVRA
jgi:hypothetical protein